VVGEFSGREYAMRTRCLVSSCIALAVMISALASAGVAAAALTSQAHPAVVGGAYSTFGLTKGGTVIAAGSNTGGVTNVGSWTDITQVASGGFYTAHTVGLKSDGTVVATGNNTRGACNVSGWSNITALGSLGDSDFTVAIKSDRSVVATGDNGYGQCNVSGWHDITATASGFLHTIGLTTTGTVVATGSNFYHESEVATWTDIKAVTAAGYHSLGLKKDGTVVAAGKSDWGQCAVTGWHNIVAIAAGYDFSLGLRRDGTVVAASANSPYNYGQTQVSDWRDIVAIAAGDAHAIGLRADGTVVVAGLGNNGQANTDAWQLTDIDDNIPGIAPTYWQWTGYGSKVADKYDVWRVSLTKGVPVELSCARTSGDANFNLFLYGPNAWDIWHFEQWLPGYQWDQPGSAIETITYTPSETGTHYLLVDCDSGAGRYKVSERCSAKLNAISGSSVTYGKTLTISGALTAAEWYAPIAGKQLVCRRTSSAGTTQLATATAGANGAYAFSFKPDRGGSWTVSLVATQCLMADPIHRIYSVVPVLSTPAVSGRVRANTSFTLSGSVAPGHKSKVTVDIKKMARGTLRAYKKVTVYANSSGKWTLKVKLGKADWRIRAGHTDADHTQGWSGYRRVRITR
jgi:alpha-tubulin suppressor-like RCC1 family protein